VINILRWAAAVPMAVLAAFAVHMALGITFGIGHGFDKVEFFWLSRDMASMPISGTYIMLVTRAASTCTLVGVAAWVVPRLKIQVGIVLAIVICIYTSALFIYVLYQSVHLGLTLGFSGWYRSILEWVSIIIGCAFGIGVAAGIDLDSRKA
jgi:hypothetical protein